MSLTNYTGTAVPPSLTVYDGFQKLKYNTYSAANLKVVKRRGIANIKMVLLPVFVVLLMGLGVENAIAMCNAFPANEFGSSLTHKRAQNYVERKLNGNWNPYIKHLEVQLKNVEKIIRQGSAAKIKRNGQTVTLNKNQLAEYFRMSSARLNVVQCLAKQDDPSEVLSLNSLPVTDEAPVSEVQPKGFAINKSARRMDLEVSTMCSHGVSQFKVKNQGPDWSAPGALTIFRIDENNKYRVSSRRMRLKKGQVVSFTVKRSLNPTGNLGLFVDPVWYARKFSFDATLTCR